MAHGRLTRGNTDCPRCGTDCSFWQDPLRGGGPAAGQLGVCRACLALLRFGPGALCLSLVDETSLDEGTVAAVRAVRKIITRGAL